MKYLKRLLTLPIVIVLLNIEGVLLAMFQHRVKWSRNLWDTIEVFNEY